MTKVNGHPVGSDHRRPPVLYISRRYTPIPRKSKDLLESIIRIVHFFHSVIPQFFGGQYRTDRVSLSNCHHRSCNSIAGDRGSGAPVSDALLAPILLLIRFLRTLTPRTIGIFDISCSLIASPMVSRSRPFVSGMNKTPTTIVRNKQPANRK